jgi:hypothetical protein
MACNLPWCTWKALYAFQIERTRAIPIKGRRTKWYMGT